MKTIFEQQQLLSELFYLWINSVNLTSKQVD